MDLRDDPCGRRDYRVNYDDLCTFLVNVDTLETEGDVEFLHPPIARLMRQATAAEEKVLAAYVAPLREDAEQPADEGHDPSSPTESRLVR